MRSFALVKISPLDLFDILPPGVEIKEYDICKSTVGVTYAGEQTVFHFITGPEAVRLQLEIADSCVTTLFDGEKDASDAE